MNRYFNILFVLLFAIGVSSCAKDELEGPAQMTAPQGIMQPDLEIDQSISSPDADFLPPAPVYINDDGDEEDEGLKPTIIPAEKN